MKANGHPHAPVDRTLENSPCYALPKSVVWPQIWCGPFKRKGNLLAPSEIETDSLAGQHITNVG